MTLNTTLRKQEDYFNDIIGDSSVSVRNIAISDLRPYKNQPFKAYSADKLSELAEDIKTNGLMQPIIVRKMQADDENPYDYYQILAGHNRAKACELVGMEKIPSIVKKDISDAEAQLIMVNTNLNQREEILPSEKAFAYKMQMEALKQQGKRTDLTSRQSVAKLNTAEIIGTANNESDRQIQRYIRLTFLTADLLVMVDEKDLPFGSGVALSYLSEAEQNVCYDYMDLNKMVFTVDNSEDIKKFKQDIDGAVITQEILNQLFAKPIKEKKEKPLKITISNDYVNKYFCGKSAKEVEKELVQILEEYFNKQEKELN